MPKYYLVGSNNDRRVYVNKELKDKGISSEIDQSMKCSSFTGNNLDIVKVLFTLQHEVKTANPTDDSRTMTNMRVGSFDVKIAFGRDIPIAARSAQFDEWIKIFQLEKVKFLSAIVGLEEPVIDTGNGA